MRGSGFDDLILICLVMWSATSVVQGVKAYVKKPGGVEESARAVREVVGTVEGNEHGFRSPAASAARCRMLTAPGPE